MPHPTIEHASEMRRPRLYFLPWVGKVDKGCEVSLGNGSGLRIVDMEKLDGYLRIKEAAEFLGVSPNTLRNWGRDGKILEHRHPMNNYRLYKKNDLAELLRKTERPRT